MASGRRRAEAYRRHDDPFSPESINLRRFVESFQAGGTWTVTDNATGDVTDTFAVQGSRQGAAGQN